ncbi:MAG: dihydropteroate synthase [candidate division KSB1 bacterium]|nr:dihydropteroate synthase [candidate division KSB1 bacterium]
MGILNVTPDSFYDGGRYADPQAAVEQAMRLSEQGADILDVGGESTRPGSETVPEEEELRRVLPVIEHIAARLDLPISIDTRKAAVAKAALAAGAEIINDISGSTYDPRMAELAAESGAGLVLMHIQGEPKTMQLQPQYDDVVEDILRELEARIAAVQAAGVKREQIVVDPGIGFGKTLQHNLEILRRLEEFRRLEQPLLIGPSRKSFIGRILDLPPEERLEGTLAAVAISVFLGACIVRVHDVRAAKRAALIADAVSGRLDVSGL